MAATDGLLNANWWELAANDVITSCCRCKSAAAREHFLRLATLSLTVALSSSIIELSIRGWGLKQRGGLTKFR